jgi:hypothetical protein
MDLRFSASEIEPFFSGGCWVGSVIWSASLVLCDVLARVAAGDGIASTALAVGGGGCGGGGGDHAAATVPSVRGLRVLELGAGCGVPGLVAVRRPLRPFWRPFRLRCTYVTSVLVKKY